MLKKEPLDDGIGGGERSCTFTVGFRKEKLKQPSRLTGYRTEKKPRLGGGRRAEKIAELHFRVGTEKRS